MSLYGLLRVTTDMALNGMCGRVQAMPGFPPQQVPSMTAHRQRLDDISKGCPGLQNKYWRLGMAGKHTRHDLKEFLQKRGFYHKSSEKLARLEALAERCDRGHQSYESYTVATLRQLIEDRDLKITSPRKATRKQLI